MKYFADGVIELDVQFAIETEELPYEKLEAEFVARLKHAMHTICLEAGANLKIDLEAKILQSDAKLVNMYRVDNHTHKEILEKEVYISEYYEDMKNMFRDEPNNLTNKT